MATPAVYEPKRLITAQQLVAASALLYTCPLNYQTTQVTTIILVNEGSTEVTATLYHIEAGGNSDEAHYITNAVTVPTDGTPMILEFSQLFMNPGDVIRGKASLANRVNIQMYGVEMAITSTSTTSTSTTSTSSSTSTTSTSTSTTSTSTSTTSTSTSTTSTSSSTSTTSTSSSTSTTTTL